MQLIEQSFLEKVDGHDLVSHKTIARFAQVQEHTITRVIRKYEADFKEFGSIGNIFQSRNDGLHNPKEAKTYYLNEQQTYLMLTFLQNTEVVRAFKKMLIKEYFTLRQEKQEFEQLKYNIHIKRAKTIDGKNIRHVLNGFKTQGIIARKKILEWKEIAKRNWGYVENQDRDVKSMQTEIMRLNNRLRESREEHENLKSQIKETFGGICQTN